MSQSTIDASIMNRFTEQERDAIFAALRLLATALWAKAPVSVEPNDGDIGDILTNSGKHAGLDSEAVHDLCDRLTGM